jgi:hypothetical protein
MSDSFYKSFKGKIFNDISHLPEFEKDMKKLSKRFNTLEEDLRNFIKVALNSYHKLKIDSRGIFHIADLGIQSPKIYKARKFACRSLKGKGAHSGIRVIYAYSEDVDKIEFIEIYYKGDKENEERERILKRYRE